MAPVFYAIGAVTILVGGWWCFTVAGAPMDRSGAALAAKLFMMAPGFGVVGGGLLFLGLGGILGRLDKISRSAVEAVAALERVAGSTYSIEKRKEPQL